MQEQVRQAFTKVFSIYLQSIATNIRKPLFQKLISFQIFKSKTSIENQTLDI